MCWISHIVPERKVAKQDILVYKIVKNSIDGVVYQSLCRNFGYVLHMVNPFVKIDITDASIKEEKIVKFIIEQGYHSYSQYNVTKSIFNYTVHGIRKDVCILRCVIPRGTVYYENANGEVVSETLIALSEFY